MAVGVGGGEEARARRNVRGNRIINVSTRRAVFEPANGADSFMGRAEPLMSRLST